MLALLLLMLVGCSDLNEDQINLYCNAHSYKYGMETDIVSSFDFSCTKYVGENNSVKIEKSFLDEDYHKWFLNAITNHNCGKGK